MRDMLDTEKMEMELKSLVIRTEDTMTRYNNIVTVCIWATVACLMLSVIHAFRIQDMQYRMEALEVKVASHVKIVYLPPGKEIAGGKQFSLISDEKGKLYLERRGH